MQVHIIVNARQTLRLVFKKMKIIFCGLLDNTESSLKKIQHFDGEYQQ